MIAFAWFSALPHNLNLLITSSFVSTFGLQLSLLHLKMGQNSNGLEWFGNVFKKMEDRCLEMCAVLEKVKLLSLVRIVSHLRS